MYDNKNTVALWKKQSKAGNDYYSGYLNIDGIDYEITLFDNKGNEKAPILKGKVKLKGTIEENSKVEKPIKTDEVYQDFGDIVLTDDDINLDIAFWYE